MLTIHHSPMTRSSRIIWLAEELELDYEVRRYELFSDAMQSAEFLAVNPLGKVPAIEDDGFVLWETLAIMEYLVAKYSYGTLLPPRETPAGAATVQWMEFGENQLTVLASEVIVHAGILPPERTIPALIERGRDALPGLLDIVEMALSEREYIAGENFSAADIVVGYALPIVQHAGLLDERTPRILGYQKRLAERPAYQLAMNGN